MPSAVSCCETSDGRLAILFSDAHVRILEIRQDKLAVQEALFTKLTGQKHGSSQQGMRGASVDDIDDFDDAFEDTEDDSTDNGEDSGDGTDEAYNDTSRYGGLKTQRRSSRSKGKGKGRGKGRGKGGKGKGSRGRRVGRSGNAVRRKRLSQLAKEGAANVLRKARNMAKKASDTQRVELKMDGVDESKYEELYSTVENEVNQLRVVLQTVEAKERSARGCEVKQLGNWMTLVWLTFLLGKRTYLNVGGRKRNHD